MTVPQPLLRLVQPLKQRRRNHVLDANEPRIRLRAVVQYALAHVIGQMGAEMRGLNRDRARRVVRRVEGVEVCVDFGERGEGLRPVVSAAGECIALDVCYWLWVELRLGEGLTCRMLAPPSRTRLSVETGGPGT